MKKSNSNTSKIPLPLRWPGLTQQHQQPSHWTKDESGGLDGDWAGGEGQKGGEGPRQGSEGPRQRREGSRQAREGLRQGIEGPRQGREGLRQGIEGGRKSRSPLARERRPGPDHYDRPTELILSPNSYQQQMSLPVPLDFTRSKKSAMQNIRGSFLTRNKSDKTGKAEHDADNYDMKVGDEVIISGQQSGVIKYLGNTHFQPGVWAGLELHDPVGLHNGLVDNVQYFLCKSRYSNTMEPHGKSDRKRESKLKPPKSYLSKSKTTPSRTASRKNEAELSCRETPDIVSSCDSKRNSLELDDSLGILSPGDMKDFTLSSMTQSFASVSSLPRDISCDDLDSAADKTVTEEYDVQIQQTPKSKSRFCLDSTKLQEIESLTAGSPPGEVSHILADIAEVSERSLHTEEEEEVDPVSKILSERTEIFLQKKKRKIHKREKMSKLEDEITLEAAICGWRSVPEEAKYCSESEMRREILQKNNESDMLRKLAWSLEPDNMIDTNVPRVPTVDTGKSCEDIDVVHLDENIVQLSEAVNMDTELCDDGSQRVDTNDQMKSDPDDTEINGEEKEKCDTQSVDDRNIDDGTSDKDEIDKIVMAGDESTDDRDVVEDKSLSVVNKHLSLASQHKQGSDWSLHKQDSMASSLTGRSDGDSISQVESVDCVLTTRCCQDTGVYSMPSSMISSNSMALSYAAEMDSSGFFSDLDTGRVSVAEELSTKHQISPITENSEPDSSGSGAVHSQPGGGEERRSCEDTPPCLDVPEPGLEEDNDTVTPRRKSHRGPGAASKKCDLLQEKPILPNKNVGSKLKAMLSEKEEKMKGREPRSKKPSRWEAVMNKIEEGRQAVKPVKRTRVRSRVFTNLTTTPSTRSLRSSPLPSGPEVSRSNSSVSTISTVSQTHNTKPKQKGITKTNGSAGTKPVREPKSVPKATNVSSNNNSNNSSNNNNNNKTTARKASVETKPTKKQSTGVKKQPEEKLQSTNTNKKVRKSSKDAASLPSKPRTVGKKGQQAVPDGGVSCQQPDLVKFTVSQATQHDEIDRLERMVASKNQHVENLVRINTDNLIRFDVMSVVLSHVSSKASFTEELQKQNVQLSHSVDRANQQTLQRDEALKTLQEEFQKKVDEYEELLSSQRQEHEQHLGDILKKHEHEISELQKAAQLEIHEMTTKHEEELSTVLNKHKDETTRLEQLHTSNIQSLKNNWTEQETKLKSSLEDEKTSLHHKISDLTSQLQQVEENVSEGSDYRVKTAKKKMVTLQQEVDSLKTVLEMKTSEVRELRADKLKLEEKLELYDQQQLTLRKMSAQVEDLRSQLVFKTEVEQNMLEDNRQLQQMVMRVDTEKKRLSMENEQLNWKMSQSFVGGREFNVVNTPDDSGVSITDSPLSMSYCEGVTSRLRPLSAPLTAGMFDEARSLAAGPDSPRVLEVVEKSESVSWKLEYEAALPSASPSPSNKRKISPHSPLVLRKCKSGSVVPTGLMTRSLDLSLARSNSYTAGSSEHPALCRTVSSHAVQRVGSLRRKIVPSFETLSESTESESDESKKNSPVEARAEVVTPAPVDITGPEAAGSDDEMCEISSSSEIEIGIEQEHDHLTDKRSQEDNSHSDSPGSDTDPDLTIRSNLKKTSGCHVESPDTEAELTIKTENHQPSSDRVMSSSLPSYDLARLFSHYRDSGGESLVEETSSSRDLSSSEGDNRLMTDSLSTLSWEDITEDYDNDGDDESRD